MADDESIEPADVPVKQIVEAALLVSPEPLSIERLQALFGDRFPGDVAPTRAQLHAVLSELGDDCLGRGYELVMVASGWRFQVRQALAPWIARMYAERPARYSRALLETLALVAYRQPVTRGDIEEVRGVAVSTGIMRTLLERNWIHVVAHRDVPGRPALYGTTREFLDYFNLTHLDELPSLAEVRDLDGLGREFEISLGLDPGEIDAEDALRREDDAVALARDLPAAPSATADGWERSAADTADPPAASPSPHPRDAANVPLAVPLSLKGPP